MKELRIFHETANDPYTYIEKWKKDLNGKVIGYFCSYTPEEMIHAAGAVPFRIFGSRENIKLADAHLQAYCCSLVRAGLEDALKGNLDFLGGTVFPHTCDSIQRLSDIWRLNAGFPFHIDLVLPVKLNTESAVEYMKALFRKFKMDLEKEVGNEISETGLRETVTLFNDIRKNIARLYEIKRQSPEMIAGKDMYAILLSSMVMERNDLARHLDEVVKKLEGLKGKGQADGKKRIILSGGICHHPDFYSMIEGMDAIVVWDDLCTGNRYFEGKIDESVHPIDAIAQKYIDRVVCPAKHSGISSRGDNLVQHAKRYNADGVIFLILKFCDPHGFDYPYLKECLDDHGIPSMLLEVETQVSSQEQLRTRLETFVSML